MGLYDQEREEFLCVTTKCCSVPERKETEGRLCAKACLHATAPAGEGLALSRAPSVAGHHWMSLPDFLGGIQSK